MLQGPLVLCILDGWGDSEGGSCDAIHAARKPFWDQIASRFPRSSLSASGTDVGLPCGQVGNSEVGHMSLGSGRVILQDLQRINLEIRSVEKNGNLLNFVGRIKKERGVCHIMGLLSDGGVHAMQDHISTLARTISELEVKVFIHAFLDGRDAPPQSAKKYITLLQNQIKQHDIKIATVVGRYYAMDRDNRLERTQAAYDAMAFAKGETCKSALEAVENSYCNGISDEFLLPAVIEGYSGFHSGDGVLLANFRSDRVLQLLKTLYESPDIDNIIGMVKYSDKFPIPCLFAREGISSTLGEIISEHGLRQLRIAETEKYAHVTFFFNGGREEPFQGEDRIIIPSPKVSTYDLKPEMSAFEVTDALVERIESKKYSLIVVNYANADMVGHTGNFEATKKAVTSVDKCLRAVFDSVRRTEGIMLITADHGNAERMFDVKNSAPFTAHTSNTVPFIVCNCNEKLTLTNGRLCDVAPTVLKLMGIDQPKEMTGNSLIV